MFFFLTLSIWGKTFYVSKKADNLEKVLEVALAGDSIIFTDNGSYDIDLKEVKKGILFFNAVGSNAILNFYSYASFNVDLLSALINNCSYEGLSLNTFSELDNGNIRVDYYGEVTGLSKKTMGSSTRAFMAFDLSNLPSGNVTSASLNLYNYENWNSGNTNNLNIQIRNYSSQYSGNGFTVNDFYNVGNEIFFHENFDNYIGLSDKQLVSFELNSYGLDYIKGTSANSLSRLTSNWKVFAMGFDADFEGVAQAYAEFYFYTKGTYIPFLQIEYVPFQILSPTANDRWRCGGTYEIRWAKYGKKLNKPQDANDMKIWYSLDGGSNYILIGSTDSDLGKYLWAIPADLVNEENSNCVIKLVYTELSGNSSIVTSEHFTIIPNEPELLLVSPNGGETYSEGDNVTIKWSYNNPDNPGAFLNKIMNNLDSVFISFSLDNGETYQLIDGCDIDGPNNDTSYLWMIPEGLIQDNFNDKCILKISSEYNGQLFEDVSDNPFTIYKKKSITLIKPEDNEVIIKTEEPYLIQWDYTGNINTVKLRYKRGFIWQTIGEFPAVNKEYEWSIPSSLAGLSAIIIYDSEDPAIADTAKDIVLTEPVSFDIFYPTSDDTLIIGKSDSLKWNTTGTCNFIDIMLNAGTYTKSYNNIPNIGVFYYTVPDDVPPGDAFFTVSTTFGDSIVYGISDTFTILDRGSIILSESYINFGNVYVSELSTHTFFIINNTIDNVNISVIHTPENPPFSIEVNEGELASGDTLTCKATFSPQTKGVFADSILFLAAEDTFKVYLSGTAELREPIFIEYPAIRCLTDTNVIVHWKVNFPVNFLFYYSENRDNLFNTTPDTIKSTDEMLYSLDNLSPGTEYFFSIVPFIGQVQFQNNLIFSFTTLKKFIEKNIQFLSKPHLEYVSSDMAVVAFKTDFPVVGVLKLGEIEYREDSSYFEHRFKLENLTPSTRYSYEVGVENNGSVYYYPSSYSFRTLASADTQPPTLLKGPSVSVSDTRASISFEADESCIALVELFETYTPDDIDTLVDSVYSKKHTIIVVDLEPGKSYSFYLTLRDLAGNEYKWSGTPTLLSKILNIAGGMNGFNTNQNADTTPPEFIKEPGPIMLYDSLFILSYQSNEQTIYNVYVYDEDDSPVSYLSNDEYDYVQKIVVPRLEPVTTYKVKLMIKDISNNESSYDDILIKTRKDNTPLKAKEVTINQPYITNDFALLSWTTDVYGDSKGLIDENQNLEEYREIVSTDIDLQHILIIKNLDKGKNYFYKLLSTDFYDQILYESDIQDLEYVVNNEQLTFVEEPGVVYTNDKQVVIGWETNLLSNTVIEYYTDDEENKIVSVNEEFTKKHRIGILNIDSTVVYHIKAISYTIDEQKIEKSFDIDMKTLELEDNEPPAPPENVTAELDSNLKIKVEWSKVNVEDLKGYNIYRQIGGSEKLELLVKNFNGDKYLDDDVQENTEYIYGVSAVDFSDNESEISFMENPIVKITDKKTLIHKNIKVLAYPNPFNGIIRMSITSDIEDELELGIYNIIGECIILDKNISIRSNEKFIKNYDLSNLSTGIYFYKVYSKKSQKIVSGKIMLLK